MKRKSEYREALYLVFHVFQVFQGAIVESGKNRSGKAGRAVFQLIESATMEWSRSISAPRYDLRLCWRVDLV